jgi:hypothetical protein
MSSTRVAAEIPEPFSFGRITKDYRGKQRGGDPGPPSHEVFRTHFTEAASRKKDPSPLSSEQGGAFPIFDKHVGHG